MQGVVEPAGSAGDLKDGHEYLEDDWHDPAVSALVDQPTTTDGCAAPSALALRVGQSLPERWPSLLMQLLSDSHRVLINIDPELIREGPRVEASGRDGRRQDITTRTVLMNDIIPKDVQKKLEERFGSRFVQHATGGAAPDDEDAVASVFPRASKRSSR